MDAELFEGYDEIVDNPMDLGTIRQARRDRHKGYRTHDDFMRDLRLVWTNCKSTTTATRPSGTADCLHKCSERLFQAWVLAFLPPPDYTRPASAAKPSLLFNYKVCGNRYRCGPAARPWENSCRNFDGEAAADETILCDHCDAQYHLAYLNPPLIAMPEHAWLCPVCANEPFHLQSRPSRRRRRRSTTRWPRKRVRAPSSSSSGSAVLRRCSWEKMEDVADDAKVEEYCRATACMPPWPRGEAQRRARQLRAHASGVPQRFRLLRGPPPVPQPFSAPVLTAASACRTRSTDRFPMPLLDPHWAVSHDSLSGRGGAGAPAQVHTPDCENPHANARAGLPRIRLALPRAWRPSRPTPAR